MSSGRMSYHVEVNEDGQVVVWPEETVRANAGIEVTFEPLILTRAQSAWLADRINAAQKRTGDRGGER